MSSLLKEGARREAESASVVEGVGVEEGKTHTGEHECIPSRSHRVCQWNDDFSKPYSIVSNIVHPTVDLRDGRGNGQLGALEAQA